MRPAAVSAATRSVRSTKISSRVALPSSVIAPTAAILTGHCGTASAAHEQLQPRCVHPGQARPGDAAQPHHQGGDLRGVDARRARHRRPDHLSPAARRRRRRHDDGRLLRGVAGRAHRGHGRSGWRPEAVPGLQTAHRGHPRRGRGDQRADRPRRAGRQRALQQGQGAGAGAVLQPAVDAVRQEGHAATTSTTSSRRTPTRPGSRSTPASTPSRSTSATTTSPARSCSPLINRRDDEFGGSLENRAKVARGIVHGGAPRGGEARARRSR